MTESMYDIVKNTMISIFLAVIAYLRPLQGELSSLFLIFLPTSFLAIYPE